MHTHEHTQHIPGQSFCGGVRRLGWFYSLKPQAAFSTTRVLKLVARKSLRKDNVAGGSGRVQRAIILQSYRFFLYFFSHYVSLLPLLSLLLFLSFSLDVSRSRVSRAPVFALRYYRHRFESCRECGFDPALFAFSRRSIRSHKAADGSDGDGSSPI